MLEGAALESSETRTATASPRFSNSLLVAVAVAAAALILASQLLVPPVVGLADNGDYARVMGYAGFQHTTDTDAERYFSFLRTRYAVVSPGWFRSGYHSSETLLALLARAIHLAVAPRSLFDLRLLGGLHGLLLLLALAGILRACRDLTPAAQLVAASLLVFVFTDVGYAAPFNSFYSQTASLLFLLLTVAASATAVRRGCLDGWLLFGYFGCALLFVGSKPQERLQAPILAAFGLLLAGVGTAGLWRKPAVWLALALCGFSAVYGRHTPYTLREAMLYQVVFDEVLVHSADPGADAAKLGLDPAWLRYIGTNPFTSDSPLLQSEFRMRFLHTVGYRKVLRLYLAHPSRLAGRIGRASTQAWSLRPQFGNFERSATFPESRRSERFAAWSRLRAHFDAQPLTSLALLLAGNAGLALATWRRATHRGRLFLGGLRYHHADGDSGLRRVRARACSGRPLPRALRLSRALRSPAHRGRDVDRAEHRNAPPVVTQGRLSLVIGAPDAPDRYETPSFRA